MKDKSLHDPKVVEKLIDTMMEDQYETMPLWMKQQLWANGIKIRSMDKDNVLDMETRRRAKKFRSELKDNLVKLQEILDREEAMKAPKPEPEKQVKKKKKAA